MNKSLWVAAAAMILFTTLSDLQAQEGPGEPGQRMQRPQGGPGGPGGRRGGGRRGGGGPGGPGGGGGMMERMMTMMPVMKALDADGNGEISAEEIANASKMLATLDKDGDGILKAEELMPDFSQMRGGGRGGPGGPGGQRGGGQQRPSITERMAEWDTNKDGKLAKDEAPEWMQPMFGNFDTDGDGFATAEEMKAASERYRGGGGGRGGRGGGQSRPKRPDIEK